MIRYLLAALALIATPAIAQTVTVKDPYGMWWAGKWTCRITDQGGIPKAPEGNTITVEQPTPDGIKVTFSHAYSVGYPWGIRSYNACNFGAGRGVKSTPSLAIRVADAGALVQPFAFRVDRKSGDFNLLAETFLTSTPTDTGWGNLEVGFHLWDNKSLNDWLRRKCAKTASPPCTPGAYIAKARGTFTDRQGVTWMVVLAPGPTGPRGYAIIKPLTPIISGVLPWGDALAYLVKAGIARPDDYMQGAFFGVEVVNGAASVSVDLGVIR